MSEFEIGEVYSWCYDGDIVITRVTDIIVDEVSCEVISCTDSEYEVGSTHDYFYDVGQINDEELTHLKYYNTELYKTLNAREI